MIRELLGLGSRTRAYRAERGGRDVVLKLFDDPAYAPRLREAAKVLGRLRHPNLVGGYELVDDSELVGLWLDFVPHGTLAERLAGEPLSIEQVRGLGMQLIDAVAALHAAGVVHRDLVAWNVRVGPDQLWLGGLDHVAPPGGAARHAPDAENDTLANLFSLGVVLYELACGASPFQGLPDDVLAAMKAGRFRRPREVRPDLPDEIDRAIVSALEPDREQRVPETLTLRSLWMGHLVVWQRPSSPPMLVETPVPVQRTETEPAPAPAGNRSVSPAPVAAAPVAADATVPPAPIASAPPRSIPPPAPSLSHSGAAPVVVAPAPAPATNRGLLVGVGALVVICLLLTGALGVVSGLYLATERGSTPAAAVAPASLAEMPRAPNAAPVPGPAPTSAPPPAPIQAAAGVPDPAPATAAQRPSPGPAGAIPPAPAPQPAEPAPAEAPPPPPTPEPPVAAAEGEDAVAEAAEVLPTPEPEPEPAPAPAPAPAVVAATPEPSPAPAPAADGPRFVHRSQVQIKLMPRPDFPLSERDSEGETCFAQVTISDKGIPTAVAVTNCSPAFAESTQKAVLRARFAPPVIDGQRMEVVTTLPVKFSRE